MTVQSVALVEDAVDAVAGSVAVARALALVGVVILLGSFLSVLHEIVVITGDPTELYAVVVAAALAGTVLARVIRPRAAFALGVTVVGVGTYLYVQSLPGGVGFLSLLSPMVDDTVELLSGLSVLRIANADLWALAAAPGPVFLGWYLGVRRRYGAASAVGGGALAVVVLTGDATTTTTLVGVLGVTLAVAFGDCDRRREPLRNADGVAIVLATMVVLTLFVGVVPGAAGAFISTQGIGSQSSTMESSLLYADQQVAVTGPVELSPAVRYTVRADREAYWRVGTYDRYTGGGWVRSGETYPYDGQLPGPPGETRLVEQTYTAETEIATLPAVKKPISIENAPVPVRVTESGTFQPASPLQPGESYGVDSQVPVATPRDLRTAGTDYPGSVESRYTQLPGSTPPRVERRTSRLTANAENPYDTARVLERWLRNNYEYSLDVERPRGNVADRFLFEMDAGYCTYFATTMVTMLRTQGIPARFVVGYTPGQQVETDKWVVRGYNSHAWVEVYFPGHGWMQFDPTPPDARGSAERQRLAQARANGAPNVDTNGSRTSDFDRGTPTDPGDDPDTPDNGTNGSNGTPPGAAGPGSADDWFPLPTIPLPTREQLGFGIVVLAGLVAGVRRTGATTRLSRAVWLRRFPTSEPTEDPDAVVAGAYHRVVHLEERAGRTRRPGETHREFLADADERARRIGELYEQAYYGPGVDAAAAEEATDLFGEMLAERSRLPLRAQKRDTGSR